MAIKHTDIQLPKHFGGALRNSRGAEAPPSSPPLVTPMSILIA